MKKGVILEVNASYVTVLTPDGEFLKGRKVKENYEVGEEIDFFPLKERASMKRKTPFFSFGKLRIALASSIAAVLLFFTAFSYYDSHQVYAYMSIDINPSIEAAVDKKLRVITLKAYNQEGRKIVANLDEWKNLSIESVTESIIESSKKSGFYNEGAEVVIATVVVDDEGDRLKKELSDNVDKIVKAHKADNVTITVLDRSIEDRELAVGKGLSTGKYVTEFILAKDEKDPSISDVETKTKEEPVEVEEEVKDNSTGSMENQTIEEPKEELSKVQVSETNKEKNNSKATEQKQEKAVGPPKEVQEKLRELKERIKKKQEERGKNKDDDDDDDGKNRGRDRDDRDDDDRDDDRDDRDDRDDD